ncbi:MAG: glutamine amidotransferase [Actinomycetaceae bacterium]|nr:glutamine amidotransferase [Actinomycetaceae bacterium]MDU0970517.1 glutamine amidotransferase [Actinomycetaceae bacterium]
MSTSKPFLLLTSRAQPDILASEYEVFVRYLGVPRERVVHHRLDQDELAHFDPDAWAGIVLCGSPFNSLKAQHLKSELQVRVEADITRLLDLTVPLDFPFLGVCYGVGTLLAHQGGLVSDQYAEEIDAPEITLTAEGRADPLLEGVPEHFRAYVGHTEAAETVPDTAVLLATSTNCPIQMFRVGRNMYGTQFHPELDWEALHIRILEYNQSGYYPPDEQQRIIDTCQAANVDAVHQILKNFATIYG